MNALSLTGLGNAHLVSAKREAAGHALASMMAGHAQVKVATFKPCNCSFSSQTHLLVAYKIVDLTYGNAVAISYTWGEFDRRKVILGHDGHGTAVEVCLG